MRFTVVSLALLALVHSLAPGVHGVPAAASDHTDSLAARQAGTPDIESSVNTLVGIIVNILGGLVSSPSVAEQVAQKIVLDAQNRAASGVLPSASSSESTSSTSLTTLFPTTTSVSGVSSSTPPTPRTRMRRQLPTSLVRSVVGSQSVPNKPTSSKPGVSTTQV